MIKYFIERTDTNEWYIPSLKGTIYGGDFVKKGICNWTNNPNTAMRFNSNKEAKESLHFNDDISDLIFLDCIVTEHEFIDKPKSTTQ